MKDLDEKVGAWKSICLSGGSADSANAMSEAARLIQKERMRVPESQ